MSDRTKQLLVKYGCCGLFVAVMLAIFLNRVDWGADGWDVILRMICDGLTVSGVLLLCAGALIWCTNEGAMDGIGYTLGRAVRMLIPGAKHRHERYYDYVQRKREKRVKGYGFLLISGGVVMAAALVVMVLFNQLYG